MLIMTINLLLKNKYINKIIKTLLILILSFYDSPIVRVFDNLSDPK